MGNSITGVDVSSWQHEDGHPINWDAVYEDGYRFAVVKATQGTSYVNPWVARDLSDASAAGLLLGAYHYYEAGEDPATQAKWAVSCLVGQPLDLGLFVDWECYSPAKFVHTQELTTFLTEARMTRPQTGIYCSEGWAVMLGEESVQLGRLWVAGSLNAHIASTFMVQAPNAVQVKGISVAVDRNTITNTRSLDIPTSPPDRPTAATAHSVSELVADEEAQADEEHNPSDDDN